MSCFVVTSVTAPFWKRRQICCSGGNVPTRIREPQAQRKKGSGSLAERPSGWSSNGKKVCLRIGLCGRRHCLRLYGSQTARRSIGGTILRGSETGRHGVSLCDV